MIINKLKKDLEVFSVVKIKCKMTTQKTKKNEKNFCCLLCSFITYKKTDYMRHIVTIKHKNNALTTVNNEKNEKNEKKYICKCCNKEYNDRAGLWRHTKKCLNINANVGNTNAKEKTQEINEKDLIVMLIKQSSEMLEAIKNGTHQINSHNNNNSNNKTFNLHFFLNETCKNAMNIMDFVDSIQLQLSDLENVGKMGYVEGISNIITSKLKELDVTERPVHCTDKKREIIYIKDENKWEKEDEDKHKIRKLIKRVASKNQILLPNFKEVHPDCRKSTSPYSDEFNKILIESMGGSGDNDLEKEDKIIKNISKIVTIDKGGE